MLTSCTRRLNDLRRFFVVSCLHAEMVRVLATPSIACSTCTRLSQDQLLNMVNVLISFPPVVL